MSDERLREAERKWKETGSVDDEARYLLERVRVGDLTRERLELAAYCGHEGARGAAAQDRAPVEQIGPWMAEIGRWGQLPCVVAALRCVDFVSQSAATLDRRTREAVQATRGWLHGEVTQEAVTRRAGHAWTVAGESVRHLRSVRPTQPVDAAVYVAAYAAIAASNPHWFGVAEAVPLNQLHVWALSNATAITLGGRFCTEEKLLKALQRDVAEAALQTEPSSERTR